MTRRFSQPWTNFLGAGLSFLDCSGRISRPDTIHQNNANLWSIHLIALDMDWSWNIFTSHNFCSILIEQLIDLEKVKSENLKFRIDLRDYGWLVSNIVDDCLSMLKNSSNWKSKLVLSTLLSLFTTWISNIAFHLRQVCCKLWLQSIKDHARPWQCFQIFARYHLKSLSIRIWADALFSDRSLI